MKRFAICALLFCASFFVSVAAVSPFRHPPAVATDAPPPLPADGRHWVRVHVGTPIAWAGVERHWTENQILTRAAPTTAAEGMGIGSVAGCRLTVCAESTRTLTGGTVQMWAYGAKTTLWARNPDLDLTIGAPGQRCRVFPDLSVSARQPGDRVLPANASVTVSGGTTTDNYLDCWTE